MNKRPSTKPMIVHARFIMQLVGMELRKGGTSGAIQFLREAIPDLTEDQAAKLVSGDATLQGDTESGIEYIEAGL